MSNASPRPWKYVTESRNLFDSSTGAQLESVHHHLIKDAEGMCVGATGRMSSPESVDAAHIVKCVNMHEELVGVLWQVSLAMASENRHELTAAENAVQAVLAKAEGK